MRADLLMCGIGSDARDFLHNKGAVVSEALVPLDKRDLFKEGAIALEALSETTNGDADSVVRNPACQLPKFFEDQPTADSADEKRGLAAEYKAYVFGKTKESYFLCGHLCCV
jgi:hypothetical protein